LPAKYFFAKQAPLETIESVLVTGWWQGPTGVFVAASRSAISGETATRGTNPDSCPAGIVFGSLLVTIEE
jgi:hypothetical protein